MTKQQKDEIQKKINRIDSAIELLLKDNGIAHRILIEVLDKYKYKKLIYRSKCARTHLEKVKSEMIHLLRQQ